MAFNKSSVMVFPPSVVSDVLRAAKSCHGDLASMLRGFGAPTYRAYHESTFMDEEAGSPHWIRSVSHAGALLRAESDPR